MCSMKWLSSGILFALATLTSATFQRDFIDGTTEASFTHEENAMRHSPIENTSSYYKTSTSLLKHLFTDYVDTLPRDDASTGPLRVQIIAHILRLLEVDELQHVIRFSAKVDISWNDYRLKWNPENYSQLHSVEVPASVPLWIPDVTWHERLEVDFLWRMQGRVSLGEGGQLKLSAQVVMNINCYMDPAYFPFDSHVCTLTFEPLVHTIEDMVLATQLSNGIHDWSCTHDQWQFSLVQKNCISDTQQYSDLSVQRSNFSENQCKILAQRKPQYHVYNLFLPATVITFMTVFAFFIPPKQPDVKIQFSLVVMLQLVIFLMYIYNSLPISATRIPLLSLYFVICLLLVALSCMMAVVISYVHWLGEDNISVPATVHRLSIQKLAPFLAKHQLVTLYRLKSKSSINVSSEVSDSMRRSSRVGIFRLSAINPPLPTLAEDAEENFISAEEPAHKDTDLESNSAITSLNTGINRASQATASRVSAEQEWTINKAEWSLVSIVLDRLWAVTFLLAFSIIVTSILLVGYNNSFME